MKVVLYTYDLEPITIIDLPHELYVMLKNRKTINVPIIPLLNFINPLREEKPIVEKSLYVRIYAEVLRRDYQESLLLYTHDEENALLLKASFLAGQTREINDIKRREFVKGLLKAFNLE
jgi:phosphoenolpyruvate carboxylase